MDAEIEKIATAGNLVDRVRAALSGYPDDVDDKIEKKESAKIDGRSKAFRSTLKRIETRKIKKAKPETE